MYVKIISSEIHMNLVALNAYSMQIVLLIWLVLTQNAKTHVLEVVAFIVNAVLLIMLQIVFVCLVILEIHIRIVTSFKKNPQHQVIKILVIHLHAVQTHNAKKVRTDNLFAHVFQQWLAHLLRVVLNVLAVLNVNLKKLVKIIVVLILVLMQIVVSIQTVESYHIRQFVVAKKNIKVIHLLDAIQKKPCQNQMMYPLIRASLRHVVHLANVKKDQMVKLYAHVFQIW